MVAPDVARVPRHYPAAQPSLRSPAAALDWNAAPSSTPTRPLTAHSPRVAARRSRAASERASGRSLPTSRACRVAAVQLCAPCAHPPSHERSFSTPPRRRRRVRYFARTTRAPPHCRAPLHARRHSSPLPHAAAPDATPQTTMHDRKCTSRRAQPQPRRFERAAVEMSAAGRTSRPQPPLLRSASAAGRTDAFASHLLGILGTLDLPACARRWPPLTAHLPREKCCFRTFRLNVKEVDVAP